MTYLMNQYCIHGIRNELVGDALKSLIETEYKQ